MSIDLNKLSAKELEALISKARKRKIALGKRKPVAVVRSKLTALARAEGYTINELFDTGTSPSRMRKPVTSPARGRKLGKVAPKYRNPANPKETWSGRGMQPRWMAAETAKGRKIEDFLITPR